MEPTLTALTTEERATFVAFARASRLLFGQLERDLQREAGMQPGQYEILRLLADSPEGSLRMSDLAERTVTSPSRITHAVERLVETGWVRRQSCASDRRGWFATLTDRGRAALDAATPRHTEGIRRLLLDRLSPADRESLRRVSELLLEQLPAACAQVAAEE